MGLQLQCTVDPGQAQDLQGPEPTQGPGELDTSLPVTLLPTPSSLKGNHQPDLNTTNSSLLCFCKRNHTLHSFLNLASFTQHQVDETHSQCRA